MCIQKIVYLIKLTPASKGLTITEGLTWGTWMVLGAHKSLKLYAKILTRVLACVFFW